MDLGLTHKVIVVSGGAGVPGSISHTLVQGVLAEGGIPIIIDLHPRGKSQVEAMRREGHTAHFIQADLTDPNACQAAIAETLENYGHIDVLINLAGGNDNVGLSDTYEAFMASLKRNLVHFFLLAKYSLDSLKVRKGCILNIGSKVAVTGQGNTSGYAAAKAGVLGLTREWAVDLAPFEIRVNALMISECWTPGYEDWINQFEDAAEKVEKMRRLIPLGSRMTKPEEVRDAALYLISERSTHITGQFIYVDGGYRHLDRAYGVFE